MREGVCGDGERPEHREDDSDAQQNESESRRKSSHEPDDERQNVIADIRADEVEDVSEIKGRLEIATDHDHEHRSRQPQRESESERKDQTRNAGHRHARHRFHGLVVRRAAHDHHRYEDDTKDS